MRREKQLEVEYTRRLKRSFTKTDKLLRFILAFMILCYNYNNNIFRASNGLPVVLEKISRLSVLFLNITVTFVFAKSLNIIQTLLTIGKE